VKLKQKKKGEKLYEYLHKKRKDYFEDKAKERNLTITAAYERHVKSITYQQFLIKGALETEEKEAIQFLTSINPGGPIGIKRSRTICISDATGSMGSIWRNAKIYVRKMISNIFEVCGEGSADLMWIAYRDYSDKKLLEASTWSNDPDYLLGFIEKIAPDGGGDGPEAVEIGLERANQEDDVTMIILIADAEPHMEGKDNFCTYNKRKLHTDYKCEAAKFKAKNIPIHTFYMSKSGALKSSFEEIASITDGTSHYLESAEPLVHVVAKSVTMDIDPKNATKYDELFKTKGFVS